MFSSSSFPIPLHAELLLLAHDPASGKGLVDDGRRPRASRTGPVRCATPRGTDSKVTASTARTWTR